MEVTDLIVKKIPESDLREFVIKYHEFKDLELTSDYSYGAFDNDRLVGVISFCRHFKDGNYNLNRLVMLDECPKNSESRFIGLAIKLLREATEVKSLVTIVKENEKGTAYSASGFEKVIIDTDKRNIFVKEF